MKRKIKKAAMMMTAAVVVLGSGNPQAARASGPLPAPAGPEAMAFSMTETKYAVKTELLGAADVSLISVTMPSDGFEFRMNPGAPFDARENLRGQILCPDTGILKMENHPVVPARPEISEMAKTEDGDTVFNGAFPGGPEQSFRLVDKISAAKDYGSAVLVLGRAGMTYENEADFEQYATYPGKSGIRTADPKAEESAEPQLYGKVVAGFYGEYRLTAEPTLKISAVRVNQARLV